MQQILTWLGARLSEPSSWAGIGLALNGLVPAITSKNWPSVLEGVTTLVGIIAFGAPEKGSTTPAAPATTATK